MEVFESEEQGIGGHLSSIKAKIEKPPVLIVQKKDETPKEMNDSDEDDIGLERDIEQGNIQRVRQTRVSKGRLSESMYRNENKDDHDSKTRLHGTIVEENVGSIEYNEKVEIKSRLDSSNLPVTVQREKVKDTRILETEDCSKGEQTHDDILTIKRSVK